MQKQEDQNPVRSTARSLYDAIWLVVLPNHAAAVDFGVDSQAKYEAIYYAVKNGDITMKQLNAVLGDGRKITELVSTVPGCNPQNLAFHTDWDVLYGRNRQPEEQKEKTDGFRSKTSRQHLKENRQMER